MNDRSGHRERRCSRLLVALAALAAVLGALHAAVLPASARQTERPVLSRSGPALDDVTDVPSCVSYLTGLGLASQDQATAGCQAIAGALPAGTSFGTFFSCLQGQVTGGTALNAALSSCQAQFASSANGGTASTPPATGRSSAAGCSAGNGTWNSDYGTLTLTTNGTSVSGTYDYDGGKITGTVSGNTLKGTWSQQPSYQPPSDAGDIQFTFNTDGSFSGQWRYGSSGDWQPWNGTCAS